MNPAPAIGMRERNMTTDPAAPYVQGNMVLSGFGNSHPCTRAYATIRRASATEIIFPSITVLMLRPALKSLSSE
jgi:hypothetical protein